MTEHRSDSPAPFASWDDDRPFVADDTFRSATVGRGRQLRRRRRAARGAVGGVATCGLLAVGSAAWWSREVAEVQRVEVGASLTTAPQVPGEPRYVLVVGTDGGLAGDTGPGRSDSVAIVRVDPATRRLDVLALPRDLGVVVDGEGRVLRIAGDLQDAAPADGSLIRLNELIAEGNERRLIDAVDSLGIPVHHYVRIDPAGLVAIVDAAGGIDVQAPVDLRDRSTGFTLSAATCTTLDGEATLALARSRHLEQLDRSSGRWAPADDTGDLGRVARQAVIGRAGLDALAESLDDPVALVELAVRAGDDLAVDESTSLRALADLFAGTSTFSFTPMPVDLVTAPTGEVLLMAPTPSTPAVVDEFVHQSSTEPDPAPADALLSAC